MYLLHFLSGLFLCGIEKDVAAILPFTDMTSFFIFHEVIILIAVAAKTLSLNIKQNKYLGLFKVDTQVHKWLPKILVKKEYKSI